VPRSVSMALQSVGRSRDKVRSLECLDPMLKPFGGGMNTRSSVAEKKRASARRAKSAESTPAENIAPAPSVIVDHRRIRKATSTRIPRPYGGTIVLRAREETAELPAFFEAARAWFAERAAGDVEHDLELALESVEDRARSDMVSFAGVTTLPPSATEISIAWESDDRDREPRVRAVDGNDYPSKPSTGNRLLGRLVLAASTPGAFVDTSKGVLFSEPRVGGEVLLRPPGERDVDGANLPKLTNAQLRRIRESIPNWSPLHQDTLAVMLVIVATQPADDDGFHTIRADMVNEARELAQKSRDGYAKGGYRASDREGPGRAIEDLGAAWIRVAGDDSDADDGIFQRTILLGEIQRKRGVVVRARFKPGPAVGPIGGESRASRRVLAYDPYREGVEKHLARLIEWIATTTGEMRVLRTVRELIEETGIRIYPNNPKMARDRLEKALDTIVADELVLSSSSYIAEWAYVDDPRCLRARNWLNDWLEYRIRVTIGAQIEGRYLLGTDSRRVPQR